LVDSYDGIGMNKKQELTYFLIIYIVAELIFVLGMFYYSISGGPAVAIARDRILFESYFSLFVGFGILAPIVFFAIRRYNRRKK
jgi:hypothetical protein